MAPNSTTRDELNAPPPPPQKKKILQIHVRSVKGKGGVGSQAFCLVIANKVRNYVCDEVHKKHNVEINKRNRWTHHQPCPLKLAGI